MKLKNRFSEEEKLRCWSDHPFCLLCGSNRGCSLHHIDGCKKKYHRSIYNSIMLCNECHLKADSHNTDSPQSEEFRKMMRAKAFLIVDKNKIFKTPYDVEYLSSCG